MRSPILNVRRAGIILLTLVIIASTSCHKEGSGGKSNVSGNVKHHTKLIPNTVVYIKYGATEFPGTDLSLYDDKTTADVNAHYEFKNLRMGNYYLYGIGNDPAYAYPVSGGIGVKLSYNKTSTIDIPVTE